ncbi:MAG: spiro-SPASM protein [Spirochaetes bacterium]|nr:spiro-SPASM protein [Spirochaetota bacterium]
MNNVLILVDYIRTNACAQSFAGDVSFAGILAEKTKLLAQQLKADIVLLTDNNTSTDAAARYGSAKLVAWEGAADSASYFSRIRDIAEGYGDIVHIKGDTPLIDVHETLRAFAQHREQFAFYTYGENYPEGVLPCIYKRGTLDRLIPLAEEKKAPLVWNSVHDTVFIDPNFFEIEVVISPEDMRYHRLSFRASSRRNVLIIQRLAADDHALAYPDMIKKLKAQPALRRTLPAYVEIELTTRQNLYPVYFPFAPGDRTDAELPYEAFCASYQRMADAVGDIHVSFSLYGEPLLHSDIKRIISAALEPPSATVYLETNGLLFDRAFADYILALNNDRLKIIFHLDAIDSELYASLYRNGDLTKVLGNIEYYLTRENKNAYMQIRKMKDNLEHLMAYYKYFEKYDVTIILQKYDSIRRTLPDAEAGNLAPLVKTCCWHLARDMAILADGRTVLCKEDCRGEHTLGNFLTDDFQTLWRNGERYYLENIGNKLPFCDTCNEWYTYNF